MINNNMIILLKIKIGCVTFSQVIGLPGMPPYWSLGFQMSRRGHNTLEDVKTVTKRTESAKIPYVRFL